MKLKAAVIGAGAFGAQTALALQRAGAQVELFDAFGPGNSRASSGDETRVLRLVYSDEIYVKLTLRAIELWKEQEKDFGRRLFWPTGVLNLIGSDSSRWLAARRIFEEKGIPFKVFSPSEAARRYPRINFDDVQSAALDPSGGYLLARTGCIEAVKKFVELGGAFRKLAVRPSRAEGGTMKKAIGSDGSSIEADFFVFACGPWLGSLFSEEIGAARIRPTRQEAFYFGLPPGSDLLENVPVWCDFSTFFAGQMIYGIPASGSEAAGRGFKAALDVVGPDFDLDAEDRSPRSAELEKVRAFLAHRFPELRRAPLAEARVCQYEMTPDAHFIVDFLPTASNVVVAGGGSGHGYKMGPAIGELVSKMILEGAAPEPAFSLSRFEKTVEAAFRR